MNKIAALVLLSLILLASTARATDDLMSTDPTQAVAAAVQAPTAPAPTVHCSPGAPHCIVAYRFLGEITPKGVAAFTEFLKEANAINAEMAFIEINSEGGGFDAGVFMAREIEMSHVPVTCVVDGEADSMASYVLQSCDMRVITKRSSLMVHNPSFTANNAINLNITVLTNLLNDLKVSSERYMHQLVSHSRVTEKQYRSKTVGSSNWYLNWQDALKLGLVDMAADGSAGDVFITLATGASEAPGAPQIEIRAK